MNGLMLQDAQVGSKIARMKNGSQQQTKAPVKIKGKERKTLII